MIYFYDYSTEYHPAMPAIELQLALQRDSRFIELSAIIDSGADATTIPMRYLRRIGARSIGRKWLRGVTGDRSRVSQYPVHLQIGNHQMYVTVVGDTINDEIMIGRDVLNRLVVTLNGLAQAVMIEADTV